MAQRRMFSKTITNSDPFLEMPVSSQNLYFHLGMNADDDGFVQVKSVMRQTGSNEDDLKLLLTKGFLIRFADGVIVITAWKINNEIRQDRYKPTYYQEHIKRIKLTENKCYSLVVPNDNRLSYQLETQVSIGKVSIGKVSIGKKGTPRPPESLEVVLEYIADNNLNVDGHSWYKYFEAGNWYDSKGNAVLNWKQKLFSYHRGGWMPLNNNQQKESTPESRAARAEEIRKIAEGEL